MAGGRLSRFYHGLFHLAQATLHDRWVKRLRLLAFLSASSVMTQVWLRSVLGFVGFGGFLPSSTTVVLAAAAIWLISYPTMWVRMVAVLAEMEAKKEFHALLRAVEHLHHPRGDVEPMEDKPPEILLKP